MSFRIDLERLVDTQLIEKEALHIMLAHLTKRLIAQKKWGAPIKRHHVLVFGRYEKFRMKNHYILISPKGKALCLLKTQFAKKPKNPV